MSCPHAGQTFDLLAGFAPDGCPFCRIAELEADLAQQGRSFTELRVQVEEVERATRHRIEYLEGVILLITGRLGRALCKACQQPAQVGTVEFWCLPHNPDPEHFGVGSPGLLRPKGEA